MKKSIVNWLLVFSFCGLMPPNAFGHGASAVAGEWLPVLDKSSLNNGDIVSQIQSSPLGNEVLIEYKGEGVLEILGDDNEAFLKITNTGVFANWDHPMWFEVQNAGPRPLPDWVQDGVLEDKWTQVSKNNFYGWYDHRLEKEDDHGVPLYQDRYE